MAESSNPPTSIPIGGGTLLYSSNINLPTFKYKIKEKGPPLGGIRVGGFLEREG